MPEKKMIGSNEKDYIEERMVLLDGFMKACGKYDYIIFSKEFKIFSRGDGEIEKALYALPSQTPLQVLEKFRLNFKIDESVINDETL